MPYSDVLEWCIDNIPVGQFSDYRDWRDACMKEINTPNLWQSATFNNQHEKAWNELQRDDSQITLEESQEELPEAKQQPEVMPQSRTARFVEESRDALGNVFTRIDTIKLNPQLEPVGIDLPERAFVPSVHPSIPLEVPPTPNIGNIPPTVVATGNVVTRFFSTAGSAIRRVFRI